MRLEVSLKQGEPLVLPLSEYLEATKAQVTGVPPYVPIIPETLFTSS